jgi:hypothetical protein
MEITGRIKEIFPEKQISASFRKREAVITTLEQYPQHILIEFVQDKGDLLNTVNVGQEVKVSIDIRGREWTSPDGQVKYFNSIHGWRIEQNSPSQENQASASTAPAPPTNLPPLDALPKDNSDEDDLPF